MSDPDTLLFGPNRFLFLFDQAPMCRAPLPARRAALDAPAFADELTPIARYMAAEMNRNAASPDARRMAEMNAFDANACIKEFMGLPWWQRALLGDMLNQCADRQMSYQTAALLSWGWKVRQDGDWDHKPLIARQFHPRNPNGPQHWHLYGKTLYFYDVWSNIHYGYVGIAAGFSEAVLLDGAGLEQIGSDLIGGRLPHQDAAVAGLRRWDNAEDRAAVTMGIQLYRRRPAQVSTQDVLGLVIHSNSVTRKPYTP